VNMRALINGWVFLFSLFLAAEGGKAARAEDWPGWRKDGSGISNETALPETWSPEDNVRWKLALPGDGISSPIVCKDRVFVTAVAPGTTRHLAYPIFSAFLCLLTLAALWQYVDGTPSYPLGQERFTQGQEGTLARKTALAMLFVSVAYAVLVSCEVVRDSYPQVASGILQKPWEFNGSNSRQISVARFWLSRQPGDNDRLEVNPQVPRDCFLAGFLGAFAVLGMNWFIGPRQATLPTSRLPKASQLATWAQAVFVLGIAGTFLVAVNMYVVAEPPPAQTTTWFQTANICMLGLIAVVGSFPSGSALRAVAAGIVSLVLAGLIVHGFTSAAPAFWHEDVWATHFPVYWEASLACCGQFLIDYARSRRHAGEKVPRAGLSTGAWPILLACIVFFVSANYFLSASHLLRRLVCIDRDSGGILWVTNCAAAPSVAERWASAPATLATPTPVTDGEHIYAHFGGVGAYCVDFTGRVVWGYDDPVPPAHWAASSPLLWRDLLILTYDVEKQSLTVALDKQTGAVRWQANRTASIERMKFFLLDAYSTPIVVQHQGRCQLVQHSNFYLCGYDLSTGKEIWHMQTPCGQIVSSPVVWNDYLIIPGGVQNKFLMALRLEDKGEDRLPAEIWRDNRQVPEISSPVAYGDHLYTVTPHGVATCRNPRNKEILWKERLGGPCDASVTAGDGKIYFCDVNGVTSVVAAGPQFRVLARNSVGEPVQASFAISGGSIFIRGDKHLFCIGGKQISAAQVGRIFNPSWDGRTD
jgi:outer membrane protein assembly factor BamB